MSLLIKNGEIVTADSRQVGDIYCEGDEVRCAYTDAVISSAYGPVTECAE
jgi:dihydroorotase-like cyclic amidohydrolase